MKLLTYNKEQVELLLHEQKEGRNTSFLKSSHNLWFRFKNYESNAPFVLVDPFPVALVFITFSERSKYANLYEIVTLEGNEGKGYGSKVWSMVMSEAYSSGMERLKLSCTPESVTWHKRNGLVFWAVDPSGSLRSDQPLLESVEKQKEFQREAVNDPSIALPDSKVIEKLKMESPTGHGFGKKKLEKVTTAINDVGEFWLRDALFNYGTANLEEILC